MKNALFLAGLVALTLTACGEKKVEQAPAAPAAQATEATSAAQRPPLHRRLLRRLQLLKPLLPPPQRLPTKPYCLRQ